MPAPLQGRRALVTGGSRGIGAAIVRRLDILVDNAGVAIVAPIEELRLEDFDRTVVVNPRARFRATGDPRKWPRWSRGWRGPRPRGSPGPVSTSMAGSTRRPRSR